MYMDIHILNCLKIIPNIFHDELKYHEQRIPLFYTNTTVSN